MANVVDSTILFLVVAHKYLGDESWWKDIQKEYVLSLRPVPLDREFDYYDQVVTISYFTITSREYTPAARSVNE
jgi:hypothetical protein